MSELYAPYPIAKVSGQQAGYRNNAWITLKEWITTEVVPTPSGSPVMGDNYKIATGHTWASGKGAIPIYLFPKTAEQQGELAGDQGAKIIVYKPKIMVAGDNAAVTELLNNILNKEVFIFMQKADGTVVQFGDGAFPAHLDSGASTSTVFASGKAGTEMIFESFVKYYYVPGVDGITEYPGS